ncbi:hypothetical protein CKA32_005915 [Geitlerinema sp. FC II]|nr:hypothetical protein CKA32_005915 [Geitlerinema sp. FC II]
MTPEVRSADEMTGRFHCGIFARGLAIVKAACLVLMNSRYPFLFLSRKFTIATLNQLCSKVGNGERGTGNGEWGTGNGESNFFWHFNF